MNSCGFKLFQQYSVLTDMMLTLNVITFNYTKILTFSIWRSFPGAVEILQLAVEHHGTLRQKTGLLVKFTAKCKDRLFFLFVRHNIIHNTNKSCPFACLYKEQSSRFYRFRKSQ